MSLDGRGFGMVVVTVKRGMMKLGRKEKKSKFSGILRAFYSARCSVSGADGRSRNLEEWKDRRQSGGRSSIDENINHFRFFEKHGVERVEVKEQASVARQAADIIVAVSRD